MKTFMPSKYPENERLSKRGGMYSGGMLLTRENEDKTCDLNDESYSDLIGMEILAMNNDKVQTKSELSAADIHISSGQRESKAKYGQI